MQHFGKPKHQGRLIHWTGKSLQSVTRLGPIVLPVYLSASSALYFLFTQQT